MAPSARGTLPRSELCYLESALVHDVLRMHRGFACNGKGLSLHVRVPTSCERVY